MPDTVLQGIPASAGIAIGPARRLATSAAPRERAAGSPEAERARLDAALATAREAIAADREAVAARASAAEAAIFDAHNALLDDDALLEPARAAIAAGATAERAWHDAAAQVAQTYRALDDALLRERAVDVLDVGRRVVSAITGEAAAAPAQPGIVVADELTPAEAAGLDPQLVHGIVTARGTPTAHAAILARSLGLPAVVGLGPAVLGLPDDTHLLLDGAAGTLHVEPPEPTVTAARERHERATARRAVALQRATEPATTADGTRIEVVANLGAPGEAGRAPGGAGGAPAEAARAVTLGAEGVGLLRTEFLFLDRAALPDEDEQVATLTTIAEALDGRPLIVRTLDAGADKPLPALPMPPEANPFLGVRGVRLGLAQPAVLATQLRAILRVAAAHPVKAMLPMVATVDELLQVRALLDEARVATGVTAELPLGIMVEVPAAALLADRLAEHADFFSIGTNDLAQYTMAAERGNERLAPLLTGPQPAMLKLIDATVRAAEAHDRWVGVCGELAGDPAAAILLAGLGVTELSMAPALIPEAKAALRAVTMADARAAARAALDAPDAQAASRFAAALL